MDCTSWRSSTILLLLLELANMSLPIVAQQQPKLYQSGCDGFIPHPLSLLTKQQSFSLKYYYQCCAFSLLEMSTTYL